MISILNVPVFISICPRYSYAKVLWYLGRTRSNVFKVIMVLRNNQVIKGKKSQRHRLISVIVVRSVWMIPFLGKRVINLYLIKKVYPY